MNKDEHYEVIDECMEDKTPETAENTGAENAEKAPKSDSTTQQQDPKTNTGMQSKS